MGFDGFLVFQELVADAIKPFVVDVEDPLSQQLWQRRGWNPPNQTVLAARLHQAADDVGGGRRDLSLAETELPKALRNLETLPGCLHGKQRPQQGAVLVLNPIDQDIFGQRTGGGTSPSRCLDLL